MKTNKNNKPEYFPATALREQLRMDASCVANRISRSVALMTSCELEACAEYGEEVKMEQSLAQRLFYLQHCRNALEQCIAKGGAVLRYRWEDGSRTTTRMRLIGPNRVKVTGLVKQERWDAL